MQDTPLLFQMLNTLSTDELREFLLFAQSPHWKGDKKRFALLNLIKKAPNLQHRSLFKSQLRKLYPPKASENNVERLLSETTEILRYYLVFQALKKQDSARQTLLSDELIARRLDEEFKKSIRNIEKSLAGRTDRSARYYFDRYRLEDLRRKYHSMYRQDEHNFGEVLTHFTTYVLLEKLKYAYFFLLWRNVKKTIVPPDLVKELAFLTELYKDIIDENPVLKIFHITYLLYAQGESKYTAKNLRDMLDTHQALLEEEELQELHLLAFNYLIHKVNVLPLTLPDLNQALDDLLFSAKYLADRDFLREGEFIPHQRFKNIITAALNTSKTADLIWAKQFLEENLHKTDPEQQQNAKLFCLAAISFYEKKYLTTRRLIATQPVASNFYRYDLKSIALRTYFEENDEQDFFNALLQGRLALNKDDKLNELHKAGYRRYFDLLEQLFRLCNPGPPIRTSLSKLQTEIASAAPLPQRKWLMEKVNSLLQG